MTGVQTCALPIYHVRLHLVDAERKPGTRGAGAADELIDVIRAYLK